MKNSKLPPKSTAKATAAPAATTGSSEAKALADLVEWSQTCPPWQRDALRRLCLQDELSEDDIVELTALCKDSKDAVGLAAEHVKDAAAGSVTVALGAVHGVRNVNALAPGEKLSFAKSGVTVLYGDNGSGKSGYARILKRACRARSPRGETVLPNIYGTGAGKPTATIDFSVNGNNRSAAWTLDAPTEAYLSAVSVFDSQTANVHVDQTNDVAYTPLPLKVLASLAEVCQLVKQLLASEVRTLEKQTPAVIANPACQASTKVGQLMASLPNATTAEITALATLTAREKSRLGTLKADLAADPTRLGRQLSAYNAKLDAAIVRIEQMVAAAGDDSLADIRKLFANLNAARRASKAASTTLFSKEALPDIGSEAWRALWEAARAYSDESAYPDQQFPMTDDGALCVLCLQELQPEAAKRFAGFEAFVKDESKRREDAAQKAYDDALNALDGALMSDTEREAFATFIENELDDSDLAAVIRRALSGISGRLAHIRHKHQEVRMPVPPLPATPIAQLRAHSAELRRRSAALVADGKSQERQLLLAERDELVDRQWLAGIKADVIAEVGRRHKIASLQKAAKDTGTGRITTKSAEVAEALVTNALRAQFAKEVNRLGVAGLAIELRQERTTQGVPLFRVRLIKKPDAGVGEVLSEGEHRCVALAAFLAELSTSNSKSCIVFDDPVSSLDHMHREAVAKRLATEGLSRQIVIFTHDVSFLLLMNEECKISGVQITFRSINRGKDYAGICELNPPPSAQPVDKVIETMGKHLENTRIQSDRGKKAEWYQTVRSFQEQLRTTWERAVEDALSPVVRRLANKVDTKGLSKITVLTIDDCDKMRAAYGRCSALLHSDADALNRPLPSPEAIRAEIQALADWVSDIRRRQEKVKVKEMVEVDAIKD